MSDEQKNDFWNSSNDDFWNKSVSDDWLKNDNPYYTSHVHEDETEGSVFHEEPANPKKDEESTGRRVHVHTIICLASIGVMIFVVLAVVFLTAVTRNIQKKEVRAVSYAEERLSSPVFDYYDNNKVTLENNCYTIVSHDVYAGFPEGYRMIAVKTDVESSRYVQNAYVMKNCYIGYEEEGTMTYKKPMVKDVFYPYVAGYGFDSDCFLTSYGCGNGSSVTGYYFFLIPEGVQKITLYMEKYDLQNDRIDKIETVMAWDMGVLPYDKEIPERLAAEGGYRYE